jgi:hypothetical protein
MRHEPAILSAEELAAAIQCPPEAIRRLAEFGRIQPHGPRHFMAREMPLVFIVRPADLPEIRERLEAMRREQSAGMLPR